ncbi:MAG: LD-carboxypeptidase [Bacteroidales bacterium]|nr:LD-carboxypeptidase [Bacteroidales bacterium]
MKMLTPKSLSQNSRIALVAPARKVLYEDISYAINYIKEKGFVPVYDDRLFLSENQFAGSDGDRAMVLQSYLDNPDIDAIICVRGGYGTVRIVDRLDFSKFVQNPKWIVGYSDVTVLHAKLQSLGIESLHATMPINFQTNTQQSLDTLFDALMGKDIVYDYPRSALDIKGKAEGVIVGGNISVLYSLLGSEIFPDTKDRILFLEDLDEYLYHIDRMMTSFERAGVFDNIKGLVVGGLTNMHDNSVPFGKSAEEIILEKVYKRNIPVMFDFPAGHIDDNRAVILGREFRM